MRSSRIIARQTKARRFFRWLQLWLMWWVPLISVWYAAESLIDPKRHCGRFGGQANPRQLDRIARGVRFILLLQADVLAAAPRGAPTRYGEGAARYVRWRRVFGARLRRATRARDFATRVFALVACVRDAPAHIADLAARITRGFTRAGRKAVDACAHLFDAGAALRFAGARLDSS